MECFWKESWSGLTLTRRADRRLPSAADRRAPGIAGKIAGQLSIDIRSGCHASRHLLGGGIFLLFFLARVRQHSHVIPAVCSSASRRKRDDDCRGREANNLRMGDSPCCRDTRRYARHPTAGNPRETTGPKTLRSPPLPAPSEPVLFCAFPSRAFPRARDARRDAPSARSVRVDRVVSKIDASRRAAHLPTSTSRSTTLEPPARWVHQNDAHRAPKTFGGWADLKKPSSNRSSRPATDPASLLVCRPAPLQVRVTGNNRTKSSLIGSRAWSRNPSGSGDGTGWCVDPPLPRSVGERLSPFNAEAAKNPCPIDPPLTPISLSFRSPLPAPQRLSTGHECRLQRNAWSWFRDRPVSEVDSGTDDDGPEPRTAELAARFDGPRAKRTSRPPPSSTPSYRARDWETVGTRARPGRRRAVRELR